MTAVRVISHYSGIIKTDDGADGDLTIVNNFHMIFPEVCMRKVSIHEIFKLSFWSSDIEDQA